MVKEVKKAAEGCRVSIRGVRQTAMRQAKAHAEKDVVRRQEKELQKVTDGYVEKIDKAMAAKEKDVMAV